LTWIPLGVFLRTAQLARSPVLQACPGFVGEAMNEDFPVSPVLIVEDDTDIREAMQEILEAEGYRACSASNGAEALRLLDRVHKPGLVLLDLMMPVMDGHAFLEVFRSNPNFADVPVVVVSAGIIVAPSINGFIKKPFDSDQLLQAVSKHFRPNGATKRRDAHLTPS